MISFPPRDRYRSSRFSQNCEKNRGLQSFGWNVYGRRMEGKKSAQSGRLGPSFSARLAPRRPHGGGGREDFSEPTECASVRVATGTRSTSTACSAIFRRRTTRLSEITACKVQTCNATALVIVEVRRGTSHSRQAQCSQRARLTRPHPLCATRLGGALQKRIFKEQETVSRRYPGHVGHHVTHRELMVVVVVGSDG